MGSRFKRQNRCERCRMHEGFCICEFIPLFSLHTRVVLVIHRTEIRKPSATGPLALASLSNSEMRVHGFQETPVDLTDILEGKRRPVLLFPREGAPVMDRAFLERDNRPITLIVPDGNWGQASRMARRIPGLEQVPTAILPKGPTTRWGLRREPHEEGLATYEAIARAIGIIESPEAQWAMEALFDRMVAQTRASWMR